MTGATRSTIRTTNMTKIYQIWDRSGHQVHQGQCNDDNDNDKEDNNNKDTYNMDDKNNNKDYKYDKDISALRLDRDL